MAASYQSSNELLMKHLSDLSRYFHLWIDDYYRFVIVRHVCLPPGYDFRWADLLIEIPCDYPLSPPGVGGNHIYVTPFLQFCGRDLKDLHYNWKPGYATPGFGPWGWWCYVQIRWCPKRDNLIRLVEMIRADMTNPPTR